MPADAVIPDLKRWARIGTNNMKTTYTPLTLILLLAFTGCSIHREHSPEAYIPNVPPIVQLKSPDYLIIIHAGEDGPLYTVRSSGGKILIVEATMQELQAELPKVYKKTNDTLAAVLWAGD